jgi:hypothetical protein
MRIKQDLLTYNAPIYLRTECSERKKRHGPNKKKSASSNLVHNWRRKASVGQYNGAAMISP